MGETQDAPLGGAVGATVRGAAPARYGGDEDEPALIVLQHALPQHFPGAEKFAAQVDGHHAVPGFRVGLPHGRHHADAGVVYERMYAAEGHHGLIHGADDVLLGGDACGQRQGRYAVAVLQVFKGRFQFFLAGIKACDLHSRARKFRGDVQAETPCGAGNQGDASC